MNLDLRFWKSDAQLCPPVADTLDRRPMEGISDQLLVNSPGLALAPDSGYVIYLPHPSPFEQGALDVNRKSDNLDSCSDRSPVWTPDSPVWNGKTSFDMQY